MKHIGLFEGIGGFSLAARWMGWETLAWCEWNEFGQKVLRHHFPEADGFGDITKTDFKNYANRIDILTGGFPCQPYSVAGKQLGTEDERHLWPEMLRAIREVQPCYVVGENVSGLINWNGGLVFEQVQIDLANEGYEILPFVLPACAVNAPHRRERIWFIAYNNKRNGQKIGFQAGRQIDVDSFSRNRDVADTRCIRCNNRCDNRQERCIQRNERPTSENKPERERWECGACKAGTVDTGIITNTGNTGLQGRQLYEAFNQGYTGKQPSGSIAEFHKIANWLDFPTQSPICGGDDGLPKKLDGITFPKWRTESIKAYGNAIVPQVAFQIFKALESVHMNSR